MDQDLREPAGVASEIVAACERAWRSFQQHHPELPDVVLVLGSGVERGRLVKLGHWWGARWEAEGEHRGEVLLAGEALHLPVEEVFEVLLHEAAHGLNAARGVKDTSRGGRYHNARYKAAAEEVGLRVEPLPPYGWARTSLTLETAQRYSTQIDELREAVRIARRIDARAGRAGSGPSEPERDDQAGPGAGDAPSGALLCGCGRRIRMAPSVAAQGPVLCGVCGTEFERPNLEHTMPTVGAADPFSVSADQAPGDFVPATPAMRAWRWAVQHGSRLDEALVASSEAEVDTLNELARSFRRQLGQLRGPDLHAGELRLAAGDQVIVAHPPPAGGPELPDAGVLGQVIAVDPAAERVLIDFPIAGRYQLGAADCGRHLQYGYAATMPVAALPTSPADVAAGQGLPERVALEADVIELDVS